MGQVRAQPVTPSGGGALLRGVLAGAGPGGDPALRHVLELPARPGLTVDWPAWVPDGVVAALAQTGVTAPWTHQVQAAELARAGNHVVVATGTASGKSLAYQLPVLAALTEDPRATALYVSPTKALGADQLRSVAALGGAGLRAASYDGDTPLAERDWARAHARWLITNPDMLHHGVLPRHGRWAAFLRRLRYVVLDECHGYRGVFGSHVALLMRRLRRICARYGSAPVFLLASATVAEPARFASRLTGLDVTAVTEDGSPRSARTVALWEPPLLEPSFVDGSGGAAASTPVRRSAGAEAARMMADLVLDGARVLAFVRSRRSAELTALGADRAIREVDPALAGRVSAYRGGFLPEERRALEQALRSGELLGVATTNALELGVDIVGLDAVLMAGFPGTRASFWQQAGRAGRGGRDALVVLLASDDPLDTYLVHHPDALLGAPVESCVLDPANPYVLAPQLACAAAELPLTTAELTTVFDDPRTVGVLDDLVAQGVLRRRPGGWFWPTPRERPAADVDIRGSGGGQVLLVETETSRMLGTVEAATAPAAVHPGAVYLHRGQSYVVDALDLDEGLAQLHADEPSWSTSARSVVDVVVTGTQASRTVGGVTAAIGEVEVTSQVIGYLRMAIGGEVIDTVPLDMPQHTLCTRAVWYTLDESALAAAGLPADRVVGALHAAEHAAIGLLPLFAMCDRWDVGGMSTALHPDTAAATVFVHDGHPGGAGFADRGYETLGAWLAATRAAIADCACATGCPSCVQSPKCGNGNSPLDKPGAVAVLDVVLGALSPALAQAAQR
ncbi:MAG: DEAD/DEAH box helicase [Pseudonocardia sp.]